MFEQIVDRLRTPIDGLAPITIEATHTDHRGIVDARLVGPDGSDPSQITGGIWRALGRTTVPRTLAQLSNVLPPTAQLYERAWRRRSLSLLSGRPFPIAAELAELDVALGPLDGAVVVDIGCSEGLYARHLAGRGGRVIAVDHARPFLRRAGRHAADEGVRLALVEASAQHLPLLDDSIDAVTIGGTMNEIGDELGALGEVARVLRPGGRCFVMSLLEATSGRGRRLQAAMRPSGIRFPSEATMVERYERCGLAVEELRIDRIVARATLVQID